MSERLVFTVPEVAKRIGVNKAAVYELAKTEHFPAIKIGRRIVIPKAALESWLETEAWKGHAENG